MFARTGPTARTLWLAHVTLSAKKNAARNEASMGAVGLATQTHPGRKHDGIHDSEQSSIAPSAFSILCFFAPADFTTVTPHESKTPSPTPRGHQRRTRRQKRPGLEVHCPELPP